MAPHDATSDEEALLVGARLESDPASEVLRAKLTRSLFSKASAPTKIDHYEIVAILGEGAMGTVFEAQDPVLDRRVAIKLLKQRDPSRQKTLLAEARALAKLADENVVRVHDAGSVDGSVYVVMELVDGQDLQQWLTAEPRGWGQVVPMFAAAASGLAAAHEAGLVHGDFKPSNVLVSDERVCVADFGMAKTATPDADGAEANPSGGTPLYMAPERLDGGRATAESDQFAFFVSLFEALFGRPPFRAKSVAQLHQAMREPMVAMASEPKTPRWLRRAVRRGLSFEPAQRFRSMRVVATLLARPRAAIRRRRIATAGALLVVGGAAALLGRASQETAAELPCQGAPAELGRVWSTERRDTIASAFEASGVPFASDSWARAADLVDAYGTAWVAARTEACQATQVHGTQSEALMDRRMACLDRRISQLDALLTALAVADEAAVTAAVGQTRRLAPLASCADTEDLLRVTPLPEDPERVAEIGALQASLDGLFAAYLAGSREGLATELEGLAGRAEHAAHPPVSTRFFELRGVLLSDAGERDAALVAYEASFRQAVLSGDLRIASRLSDFLAADLRALNKPDDSVRWVRMGDDLVQGVHDDGRARASHDRRVAKLLHVQGRYDDAEAINVRVEKFWAEHEPQHPDRVRVLSALGTNRSESGNFKGAIEAYRGSVTLAREVFGDGHPDTARALLGLGTGQVYAGEYAEALGAFDEALAIAKAIWGEGVGTVIFINGRALALTGLRRLAEAEDGYRRALEIWGAVHGKDHFENATFLGNLSGVQTDGKHYEAALETLREKARVEHENFDAEHPRHVWTQALIANNEVLLGRYEAAMKILGPLAREGKLGKLIPTVEARARFNLARALVGASTLGSDARDRARTEATRAKELYAGLGKPQAEEVQRVDRWMEDNLPPAPN